MLPKIVITLSSGKRILGSIDGAWWNYDSWRWLKETTRQWVIHGRRRVGREVGYEHSGPNPGQHSLQSCD